MKQLSERSLLLLLAAVQFTHIMDFMIMMPLGPQLMRVMDIGPGQFAAFVAAYSISSGIVSLLAAPFVDRFDRKKLLLFTYAGFTLGTLVCALSQNAATLLVARAISGAFGGLATATVLAIVGDVIPAQRRAAGMGIVMTAFSVAAAFGVPFGLQLAQLFRWETPFFVLAGLAGVMWTIAYLKLPSIRGHLENGRSRRAFMELLRDTNAGRALLFMVATVLGHFTIIPLLSPYLVHNVGLPERDLFLVYLTGGVLTVFTAPRIGKLADQHGRRRVFAVLVVIASFVTLFIANSGPLPVWAVLVSGGAFFVFASGRFVPGQAIMTLAVPASRRGAFMSLSGCARDLAMGLASGIAGWVVTTAPSGELVNFHWLGWIAVTAGAVSIWLGSRVRVHESDSVTIPVQGELDAPPLVSTKDVPPGEVTLKSEVQLET
ncbi:MAG TPA: MFS transporter [Verrucomicrobiota bacterium]|nr:MFS transporter [Verrucomicrobiota bacterium]